MLLCAYYKCYGFECISQYSKYCIVLPHCTFKLRMGHSDPYTITEYRTTLHWDYLHPRYVNNLV